MKRKSLKRAISLILCAAAMLSVFAGCNKDNNNGNNSNNNGNGSGNGNAVMTKPVNVWRETLIPVPAELTDVYNAQFVGDTMYFPTSTWDYETNASTNSICTYNLVTKELKTILSLESPPQDYESQRYEYLGFGAIAPLADGTFWVVVQHSIDDYSDPENYISEQNTHIKHYDAVGNELAAIDINNLDRDNPYMWVNGMAADEKNNLYVLCSGSLYVLDMTTNQPIFSQSSDGMYMESLIQFGDGRISVSTYDNQTGKQILRVIDAAAKGWGATIEMSSGTYFDRTVPGDENHLFFYSKYNSGIFGFKADGTSDEIVNFLNSDLNSDNINGLAKLDNGDFLMIWYDYDSNSGNNLRFSQLTRVPDDELRESIVLTYACMWLDYDVKRKIMAFNKASDTYRIVIDDYSRFQTDDDWEAGYKRLASDIIMGKVPDIMNLDNININAFISKGLLADIYALIDASPSYNRNDFEQSVLHAAEINGKLYSFTPSFNVYTVAGKRSVVGDTPGWTLDDLNALMRTLPEGTESFFMMTKSQILDYSLMLGLSQYIDWDTGKVDFSDNFIKLLEYANTFPKEIDYDRYYGEDYDYEKMQNRYRDNHAILETSYVSGYRSIRDTAEWTFGEEITYIGFPTDDKSGSIFMPSTMFGISGKSSPDKQQACFDFISSMIQTEPDFASSNGYLYTNFSISKTFNEKVRAYELTPLRERPGYIPPDSDIGIGDGPQVLPRYIGSAMRDVPLTGEYSQSDYEASYPLTQYEIDAIDALIQNTSKFYYRDNSINNIIMEESEAYFAGQKPAAEAARLIQSRVQLYVSESM